MKQTTRSNAVLAAVGTLAFSWLMLGLNSDRTPWLSDTVWIIACTIVAGTALALARWQTRYALIRYTIAAVTVGILRSIAYLTTNAAGPAFVWLIVTVTTIAATAAIIHVQKDRNQCHS